MKPRALAKTIIRAMKTFPAVVVTGPRQSGKTTLLKNILSKTHTYISLEDPDVRMRAKDDPRGFLDRYEGRLILDEIQYVPELLSYIKSRIDEDRRPGKWIITGSQNFILMKGVSESLAGRAAILSLLPFSYSETINRGEETRSVPGLLSERHRSDNERSVKKSALIEHVLLGGFFPEVTVKKNIDKTLWFGSYISTYLERDVRNLSQVGDLSTFERFLRLCAVRTGQVLNISDLARDSGISVPTAKRWISILETGYQVYLLYPYYRNIGKRLIKSPKIYFSDTGLACYLMGLKDGNAILNSPQFGHIFETFVITDFWKRFLHSGNMPSLYYLKTRDGLEVDMIIEDAQKLHLFEIKAGATITGAHTASLVRVVRDVGKTAKSAGVISCSSENFNVTRNIRNYSWRNLLAL